MLLNTTFPVVLACVALALMCALSMALATAPAEVLIGIQFPIFKANAPDYSIDGGGRKRLGAFMLALKEVNNKADGIMDSILPNTQGEPREAYADTHIPTYLDNK